MIAIIVLLTGWLLVILNDIRENYNATIGKTQSQDLELNNNNSVDSQFRPDNRVSIVKNNQKEVIITSSKISKSAKAVPGASLKYEIQIENLSKQSASYDFVLSSEKGWVDFKNIPVSADLKSQQHFSFPVNIVIPSDVKPFAKDVLRIEVIHRANPTISASHKIETQIVNNS